MDHVAIRIDVHKIADELIEINANDETTLNDFGEFIHKVEKIKKVLKTKRNGKNN